MLAAPHIRLAQPTDALDISCLSREAIEYGLEWSWTPRRVAASLRDSATNVVVARSQASMAGFGIMKYGDDEAHLLLLAVAPRIRRRGVASALLAWLEKSARVAGIGVLRLEVRKRNAAARAFYAHHGFNQTGELDGYYQGVEDAVCLLKDLRLVLS